MKADSLMSDDDLICCVCTERVEKVSIIDYRVDWSSQEILDQPQLNRDTVYTGQFCDVCLEDPPPWFKPLCIECEMEVDQCTCTHSIIEGGAERSEV